MLPPPVPSISAGGGGPSGSSSNAGVQTPISTPFNFDGSGWVVNFGGSNTTSATGNRDANGTAQSGTPTGGIGALLGGLDPMLLGLIAVGVLLVMRR